MKKYLGSFMNAYAALGSLLIIAAAIWMIIELINDGAYSLLLIPVAAIFAMGAFVISKAYNLFAYGVFTEDRVIVKCPLRKSFEIPYTDFKEVGAGDYIHGVLNTSVGTKVNYLYFAKRNLTEEQKHNINLIETSASFIKFSSNKKICDYLISVLPNELCTQLKAII